MGGWVKKFEYRDSIILAVRRTEYYNSATMTLSKCMTDIQAEMKSRIEDECRKQMETLLEDTFAKKWEEYTNKTAVMANASPQYTEGYGRLDLTAIPNNGVWGSHPDAKTVLSKQQTMFEFSSKNVYFIHFCASVTYSYPNWRMKGYFIDNYGFYHMIQGTGPVHSAYPHTPVRIDVINLDGENQYVYPLSDALIDNVKALPSVVGFTHTNDTNNTELESLIKVLPSIRMTASIFYNQTVALDALQKENAMITQQNAASDDLKHELVSLLNTLQQDYDALQEREKMTCDTLEQTTHTLAEKTAEIDDLQKENAMIREELRLKTLSLEESLARETERQALQEQAEAEAEAEVKEEVEPSKENVKEEEKEEDEEEYEPQSWRWWSN